MVHHTHLFAPSLPLKLQGVNSLRFKVYQEKKTNFCWLRRIHTQAPKAKLVSELVLYPTFSRVHFRLHHSCPGAWEPVLLKAQSIGKSFRDEWIHPTAYCITDMESIVNTSIDPIFQVLEAQRRTAGTAWRQRGVGVPSVFDHPRTPVPVLQ